MLVKFGGCSGLRVKLQKSQMFCTGMSDEVAERLSSIVQIHRGQLLVRYLGLPLITKRLSHGDCIPLVEKVCNKIQC